MCGRAGQTSGRTKAERARGATSPGPPLRPPSGRWKPSPGEPTVSARLGRTTARAADRSAPGARTGARSHRRAALVAVRGVWGTDRVDIPHRLTRLRDFGQVPRYLDVIGKLDPGDGSLIRAALNDIARAYGVTRLAREPCPSRVASHKALAANRNPTFSTRMRIARVGTEADNHDMAPFQAIGRPRSDAPHRPRVSLPVLPGTARTCGARSTRPRASLTIAARTHTGGKP